MTDETKMINSQNTLVAYLDILGYRGIIENETPEDFYNSIVDTFNYIQGFIDFLSTDEIIKSSTVPTSALSNAEIAKAFGFKILSDTIIIYCDYNDIERINKKYFEKVDNESIGAILFLNMVSSFVLEFIARTGYLLRGSICLGKFYTNTFGSCLLKGEFVFSEAFVRGYDLEQLAIHPRILVDEALYDLLKSKLESESDTFLFESAIKQDKDGELYFDFYENLRDQDADIKQYRLVNITKQINNMLTVKQDDKRVWKKWYWFKEYHNEKIKSFAKSENQDLSELLIN